MRSQFRAFWKGILVNNMNYQQQRRAPTLPAVSLLNKTSTSCVTYSRCDGKINSDKIYLIDNDDGIKFLSSGSELVQIVSTMPSPEFYERLVFVTDRCLCPGLRMRVISSCDSDSKVSDESEV